MEILIKDIPEEGMDLHADAESKGWFQQRLQDALEDKHEKGDKGAADFHFFRTGGNVDFNGEIDFDYHPCCTRCLNVFQDHLNIPLHLTLAPLYESDRQLKLEQKEEVHLIKEDLEFSYYEGDTFNLGDLVEEQILLALPLQNLCKPDCKGLCQQCGTDLNEGLCGCKIEHVDHRWDALKQIKLKK